MGQLIDMTGMRYGRLTVKDRAPTPNGETRAYWRCECDCGNQTVVTGKSLRNGGTKSCGCLAEEWARSMGSNPEFVAIRAEKTVRHGHKRVNRMTPEYRTWLGMKRRCYDKKCKDYPNWGGRGIKVHADWVSSFETFLADMGHRPSSRHQVDRIDPDKDYSRDNCRWVTPEVQGAEHRRSLREVTVDGVTFPSISAAGRHFGVGTTTINERIKAGMSLEEAVTFKAWSRKSNRTRESYLRKDHPDRARLAAGK